MTSLTIFANFRIDSEERLIRMQDSFHSFCEADIEMWVVNIRGQLKNEAAEFLKKNLGGRLKLFELESKNGWFHDSRQMLHEINSEYVFYWIEDHLCLAGVDYFNQVVSEMKILDAEYLLYSWFHQGEALKSYSCLPSVDGKTIIKVDYDAKMHRQRIGILNKNKLFPTYIISCTAIFNVKLFKKVVATNDPIFKRYPKDSPFDFEKSQRYTHWLPIRVAQTKLEFFAPIDDDQGRVGYSLIARGLYPSRVLRESILKVRNSYLGITPPLFVTRLLFNLREEINIFYAWVKNGRD